MYGIIINPKITTLTKVCNDLASSLKSFRVVSVLQTNTGFIAFIWINDPDKTNLPPNTVIF